MIPRRLLRCVPVDVPEVCERWWARFGRLHPGWELRTIADPIDPAGWPLLGHLHEHATSGAQLAGFVRLEAVHRWGGWYVDMDVEPVRPFDDLAAGGALVIGTEDGIHLTDAVFGAPPRHPALAAVIAHVDDLCTTALRDGRPFPGPQATGPLATTAVLTGRHDVVVAPQPVFYPYSYLERNRANDDHAQDPTVHAVHHWHFSWAGS